jgi:hypothetical protein
MADAVVPRLGEVLHSNDSKSLWNYTLSPGWTASEVEVFRVALMKFGFGKWSSIVAARCLPGKTVAQLNNQAQRMIGQQSTSEFTGLHFDPSAVFAVNSAKEGHRKNNCLINTESTWVRRGFWWTGRGRVGGRASTRVVVFARARRAALTLSDCAAQTTRRARAWSASGKKTRSGTV